MIRFPLDSSRTALLIVDMQSCFVSDSPVAAPEGMAVATRLNRLAAACRMAGIPVIWQRTTCAVMAFGFAEVVTAAEVTARIESAAAAAQAEVAA